MHRMNLAESIRDRSRMGGNLTITRADGSVESTRDNTFAAFAETGHKMPMSHEHCASLVRRRMTG